MASTAPPGPVAPLVENFFRHEAGRLVAVLTRFFGWRHFDLIEETVQATLLEALQSWGIRGVPDNPAGWIHQVAKNKILDSLRRDKIGRRAVSAWAAARPVQAEASDEQFQASQIEDSELRMIFACCHPKLGRENQIALTLKALCGFGNSEIARALLVTPETVKKRLQRATRFLVDEQIALECPESGQLAERLDVVHQVLYLIFNEGYSSSQGESAIRGELCEEAARLCYLLCCHPDCSTPTTFALIALMLFHAARLDARLDHHGLVLLMEDQDRSRWDHQLIRRAKELLDRSAEGTVISSYHLEAGIALYHCSAKSYEETDWPAILRLYEALLKIHRSPVYLLNRAIVLAQIKGPKAGISALEEANRDGALRHYHLYDATLGEVYRRAGNYDLARRHLEAAKQKTSSPFDREIIERRLKQCH
jgi:RNA polymerase sigma-70 factor (ECF subfamily)